MVASLVATIAALANPWIWAEIDIAQGEVVRQGQTTTVTPTVDLYGDLVRCSMLSDPDEPEQTVSAGADLHAIVTADCGSGCILNLSPGLYDDTTVTIGPGSDDRIRPGSLTGATGTILIRALDPNDPPVLRSAIGEDTGAFYLHNVDALVRLEDLQIDGRRSEQTTGAVYEPCPDTSPPDGICDSGTQSFNRSYGFGTLRSDGGDSQSCLLRVTIHDTVGDGVWLRQAINTTVEDSVVYDTGCTSSTCPNISVPTDLNAPDIKTQGRGINFDSARGNVGAVSNEVNRVTKTGIQCIRSTDCEINGNTISEARAVGAAFADSSGSIYKNTVTQSGLLGQSSLLANVGFGIQWAQSDSYSGLTSTIKDNTISGAWGSGISVGLDPAATSDAFVVVTGNTISGACLETTRSGAAGMELGDPGATIAKLRSTRNVVLNHECSSGIVARNLVSYMGRDNTVSGNFESSAVVYDELDTMSETNLSVDEDIFVDSASAGVLLNCSLNDGASITGAVEGNVTRTNCGPAQVGGGGSSEWNTLEWDADDWG